MYSSAYVWAKIISYLEEHLTSAATAGFFDDAEIIELDEKQLILYSPHEFRREYINRRLPPLSTMLCRSCSSPMLSCGSSVTKSWPL